MTRQNARKLIRYLRRQKASMELETDLWPRMQGKVNGALARTGLKKNQEDEE